MSYVVRTNFARLQGHIYFSRELCQVPFLLSIQLQLLLVWTSVSLLIYSGPITEGPAVVFAPPRHGGVAENALRRALDSRAQGATGGRLSPFRTWWLQPHHRRDQIMSHV